MIHDSRCRLEENAEGENLKEDRKLKQLFIPRRSGSASHRDATTEEHLSLMPSCILMLWYAKRSLAELTN